MDQAERHKFRIVYKEANFYHRAMKFARAYRVVAIVEVVIAFVVVHVGFRAIKEFTALGSLDVNSGLNFAPGVVMILFLH